MNCIKNSVLRLQELYLLFILFTVCIISLPIPANASSRAINYAAEFDRVYSEINTYALSDSVWRLWRSVVDSHYVIPPSDSVTAIKKLAAASNRAREAVAGLKAKLGKTSDSLEVKRQTLNCLLELEKARVELETSIKLNPFDHRTQKYLIWIYQQLSDMYTDTGYFERSAALLETLVYIVKDDPQLHYKLGEQYMWLNNWEKAHENVQRSIDLLLDTDWESINTNTLFSHYILRAEAEMKMGNVEDALLTLNYAKLIAPTPSDESKVQWQIDWINWDNGNLENSRQYDELQTELATSTDYPALKRKLESLLKSLKTDPARYEILWQISRLQFQHLNEKDEAVSRLQELVHKVPLDTSGYAVDPRQQKYINDYGLMCYNLGISHVEKEEYRLAFLYFYQSTCFKWNGVGKSYLQLAYLASAQNEYTLDYCNHALKYANALAVNEIVDLYHLLFQAHANQGEFDEAKRWYQQWVSLKQ
ncbi:hypothetical protein JW960_09745 [candidate division KSB1 bacterium]|nr:hypothetical protein [candidate division KSB1 bacterium]